MRLKLLTRTKVGLVLAIIGFSILMVTAFLLVARETGSSRAVSEPSERR